MQILLPFCSPSSLLTLFIPLTTLCPESICLCHTLDEHGIYYLHPSAKLSTLFSHLLP